MCLAEGTPLAVMTSHAGSFESGVAGHSLHTGPNNNRVQLEPSICLRMVLAWLSWSIERRHMICMQLFEVFVATGQQMHCLAGSNAHSHYEFHKLWQKQLQTETEMAGLHPEVRKPRPPGSGLPVLAAAKDHSITTSCLFYDA